MNIKFKKNKNNNKNFKNEDEEIELLKSQLTQFDWSTFDRFDNIPISQQTKNGLSKNNYLIPTDIQKQSIGYALAGNDVLGAAKTGSGKTLAFLIPILECLYKHKWTSFDGLGALIISPTRELSYQTFEVLKKIGADHDFSAGLVIGGKDLEFESKRMDRCNIVVCTPGRLLQHMDENPLFTCDNLKMLILDEADRILDLGFAKTMNSIIPNLPKKRQTLLFSATQTKSVKDLAKLSLQNPIYVSSHERDKHVTPDNLTQSFIVCELEEKINLLWSFIKQHLKQKIIVFMSTCKQVKFVYELFCHLRPGIPMLALYGTLHQLKRMSIYDNFCKSSRIVLFATDIAARGLDFPSVNWVVQLDCPEDVNTYIHRVGRTARFEKNGEAILVLTPSEENSMVKQLEDRKIPIEKIAVNPRKYFTIQRKAEALLAKHIWLKESAQRAVKAYAKNVYLMTDKSIFKYESLNMSDFAKSFGLLSAPRIRFIERKLKIGQHLNKNVEQTSIDNNNEQKGMEKIKIENDEDDEDFNDLFKVKKYDFNHLDKDPIDIDITKPRKILTKAAVSKRLLKKNIKLNTKIVFDDDCNAISEVVNKQTSEHVKKLDEIESGIDIELAKKIMKDEDAIDKKLYRNIIKQKHLEKKLKMKEMKNNKFKNQTEDDNEESTFCLEDDGLTQKYIDELPDPDKIYAETKEEDPGEQFNEAANNVNSELNISTKSLNENKNSKRKRKLSKPGNKRSLKKSKQSWNEELIQYEKMAQELLNI